ncbi:hematopoietic prostaglandin D synthase-like [Halichondria panicea]|uniref:hematopoietic prostaglandin D synthase-like n=1 Tax=Halichondria panicea TaxID=6063 RepID=UPI00312BA7D4
MPTYKLTYFNIRGRVEIIRLIFKQAGVEFEDVRVSQGEEWLKLKPSMPYGTIPVLEVDGKQLPGRGSIQRYLAEKFGLAGSNDFENAQVHSIVDAENDFAQKFLGVVFEKDESRKFKLKKKLEDEVMPKYLGIFEQILTKNASPDGWFFGSKVTYADLGFFNMMCWSVKEGYSSLLDKYPAIKKNIAAVEALPNIAKWLKERPVTAM